MCCVFFVCVCVCETDMFRCGSLIFSIKSEEGRGEKRGSCMQSCKFIQFPPLVFASFFCFLYSPIIHLIPPGSCYHFLWPLCTDTYCSNSYFSTPLSSPASFWIPSSVDNDLHRARLVGFGLPHDPMCFKRGLHAVALQRLMYEATIFFLQVTRLFLFI